MSEDGDIFEDFDFVEEIVFDPIRRKEVKTGKFFIIDKKTGRYLSDIPEPSYDSALRKARRLLKERRSPDPDPPSGPKI